MADMDNMRMDKRVTEYLAWLNNQFENALDAALAAFLCDRLGVGVPWLPSGLHAVSALSGLTAGASPVLHSDMGWQYRHPWWRERLGELGIRQSMSRKGNCLDNAATEQVFGHLKDEFYRDREFDS